MSAAQPQVMYLTKCRFCGMQPPAMPPFVPILNGGIDPKMISYIGELQKHIEKKHPEQFAQMRQTILTPLRILVCTSSHLRWSFVGTSSSLLEGFRLVG